MRRSRLLDTPRRLGAPLLVASVLFGLAGCATRPTDVVLQPSSGKGGAKQLEILAVTDRAKDPSGIGFASGRSSSMTFERYEMSIPPDHKPSKIEWAKSRPDARKDFVVTSRQPLDRNAFIKAATRPDSDGSVGLFVHGYNYTYQEGLFRLAQVATDSQTNGTPVLFSWPSEGLLTGYVADRDAALYARDDLVSVIISMTQVPGVKRVVVFGHSMGGFLLMESIRQLKLEGRTDVLKRLVVVLAAPDIDADVFRAQLSVIGPMATPITVFVSKDDKALAVSSFLGGERPRAGRLDVDDPGVRMAAKTYDLRIVDITSLNATDGLGHDRYANLAGIGPQLAALGKREGVSANSAGAFVFDAAASAVSSPFRLASAIVSGQ